MSMITLSELSVILFGVYLLGVSLVLHSKSPKSVVLVFILLNFSLFNPENSCYIAAMAAAKDTKIRALLLGSTGAVGTALTRQLVRNPQVETVVAVVREKKPLSHWGMQTGDADASAKLHQIVLNYTDIPDTFGETLRTHRPNTVFNTFGTTRAAAGGADAFRRIELSVLGASQCAKNAGASHYMLVTSQSASANSFLLYPEVKGLIEDGIKKMKFASTAIFRPGLLITPERRGEKRTLEALAQKWWPKIENIFPEAYKSVNVEVVANALVQTALKHLQTENSAPIVELYSNDAIRAFGEPKL